MAELGFRPSGCLALDAELYYCIVLCSRNRYHPPDFAYQYWQWAWKRGDGGGERGCLSERHPHLWKIKAKSSELSAGRGHILLVANLIGTSKWPLACYPSVCTEHFTFTKRQGGTIEWGLEARKVWLLTVSMWPRTAHGISPGLRFLICEMHIIQVAPRLWL